MVSFNPELKSCSLCESSTDRELFEVDNKQYVVCVSCYNVIRGIVQEILKEQKPKQQDTKQKKKHK